MRLHSLSFTIEIRNEILQLIFAHRMVERRQKLPKHKDTWHDSQHPSQTIKPLLSM